MDTMELELKSLGFSNGIMHKDERNARTTEVEIGRNKKNSTVRYKMDQYFELTTLHPRK